MLNKLSLFKLGRLSRLGYARNSAISISLLFGVVFFLVLINIFAYNLFQTIEAFSAKHMFVAAIPYALIICTGIIIWTFATIQRFHDINVSGWWTVGAFVPFLNFFTILFLLFKKGNPKENRFGDISERPVWKKTIITFFILVFLIVCIMLFLDSASDF